MNILRAFVLILCGLALAYAALDAQVLTNTWNPTGNAGQTWTSHQFRDIAVNTTGGPYDGRVYMTSSATTLGVIYYDKTTWQNSTAPAITPDGSFAATPPTGTWGSSAPYGIAIDGEGYVYVADYTNRKIARYNGDGTGGAWLKQPGGVTDLVLTRRPRTIRITGSGENTRIYYGDGSTSARSQNIYEILPSGDGWIERLLLVSTTTRNSTVYCVLKKNDANTVYVGYSSTTGMQKFDSVGSGPWMRDTNFVPGGYTVRPVNGAAFLDAENNYIAITDMGSRQLYVLDGRSGLRLASRTFGLSGATPNVNASVAVYSPDTLFVNAGRSSTPGRGGYFEKIASDVPIRESGIAYRSAVSGSFTSASTWEAFDGSTWNAATHVPYLLDSAITILDGDTVSITAATSADQLIVEPGGVLRTAASITLTMNNAPGSDLLVNGEFLNLGGFAFRPGAIAEIANGGRFVHNSTTSITTPMASVSFADSSIMIYRGRSTLTPSTAFPGRTYGNLLFESTSGRMTISLTSGSAPLTVKGALGIGTLGVGQVTWSTNGYTGAIGVAGPMSIGVGSVYTCGASVVSVGSDWLNQGTFNAGTGTVRFTGTALQSLTHTGTGAFNAVEFANAAGIGLRSNVTFNGVVTFGSGPIFLDTLNVTLGGSASVVGADAGRCFVTTASGRVIRGIGAGSSFVFPVASDALSYNPVTIVLDPADPVETFRVHVGAGLIPSTSNDQLAVGKTWFIDETVAGGNNATLTYQWNTPDEGPGFDRFLSAAWRHDGTNWLQVSPVTLSGSGPYVASTTIPQQTLGSFCIAMEGALPVQLTGFSTSATTHGVVLSWRTATETTCAGFEVERRGVSGQLSVASNQLSVVSGEWQRVGFVAGAGNSATPREYSYADNTVTPGRFVYRLKQLDSDGKFEYFGNAEVEVGIAPKEFSLADNFPNPFNPSTLIRFTVREDAHTTLRVFDAIGREVKTLFDGPAQTERFYDVRFEATGLASGIYFYALQSGSDRMVRRMLLVK